MRSDPKGFFFSVCSYEHSWRRTADGVCDEKRFLFVQSGGVYFCLAGYHDEILQKPDRPLPCPYLPTYLPTLLMGN